MLTSISSIHEGSVLQAQPPASPFEARVALLHRLALYRGHRVAASRIAEHLPSSAPVDSDAVAVLREAAQVFQALGWPARVVHMPLSQARRLAPTLVARPNGAAASDVQLLTSPRRFGSWLHGGGADPEVLTLDLRVDPQGASIGQWLWAALCSESAHVLAAILALALSQALALLGPAVAWLVTDRALPDGAKGLLTVAVLGLVALACHAAALGWWRDRVTRSLDQRLRTRANAMMFESLLRGSYADSRDRTVGEGLQRLSSAELVAGSALTAGLGPMLGLVSAIGAWATLCAWVPAAAWALAAMAWVLILLSVPLARHNARWQGETLKARASQQSLLLELLQGAPALRAAGAEQAGTRRWLRRLVDEQTATLGQVRAGLWLDVLLEGSMHLTRAGWLAWGGAACVNGEISLGAFLACAMLAEQVMRQAIATSHALMNLNALAPHWHRLNEVLRSLPPVPDMSTTHSNETSASSASASDPSTPALRLKGVSFRYDARAPWAVHEQSLEVPVGALMILSGASGAGKTTLLRLAAGLLTPQHGQIEVFGQAVQPGHPLMGYLPQEAPLFEGSIASNLRWLAGCSTSHLLNVARRTGLDDWVRTLPMGYATRVSAGGGAFSGGQRQLIALTAVLASDRPLLLLDEPMSQLDRLSRRRLLDSGLFQGRTLVIISHDRNGLSADDDTPINSPEATLGEAQLEEPALVA